MNMCVFVIGKWKITKRAAATVVFTTVGGRVRFCCSRTNMCVHAIKNPETFVSGFLGFL
jgi:hypothetical protein